jgi:drug/metabolite transporter (DMT)-like permease
MIAFASNSLLCRAALKQTHIDAATFTFVRIFSGAVALSVILTIQRLLRVEGTASPPSESLAPRAGFPSPQSSPKGRGGSFSLREEVAMRGSGNWISALALVVYAAGFSFAYVNLSAGTGALLLFGAVQATMILWGLHKGERLDAIQVTGLVVALTGLVVLVFPGLSAPPLIGSILMLGAGVAWGVYSLRGKGVQDPASVTAGNFVRAVPLSVVVWIFFLPWAHVDPAGVGYAIISGVIASGLGYVIWYSALPGLKAASAATVQLSVPVLAATGGILLLGESITLRYVLASLAVLGGIALVVVTLHPKDQSASGSEELRS